MQTITRSALPSVAFEAAGPTDMRLVVDGVIVTDPTAKIRYSGGLVAALDLVQLWMRLPGRAGGELARAAEWIERHTNPQAMTLAGVRDDLGRALDIIVNCRSKLALIEGERDAVARQAGLRG